MLADGELGPLSPVPTELHLSPGEQLRTLRTRLAVTTREVSEYSRVIAQEHDNEEFYTSHAWLTQLENKDSIPSIYKLFSLSVIYRTKFTDLLAIFGIDLSASARHQMALPLQSTHLTTLEVPDPQQLIRFPMRFEKGFNLDQTSLISRMVEVWGEVPVALIQKLDVRRCHYGYIGLDDYTMYPFFGRALLCRLTVTRPGRRPPTGRRSSIGRFTLWNSEMVMLGVV